MSMNLGAEKKQSAVTREMDLLEKSCAELQEEVKILEGRFSAVLLALLPEKREEEKTKLSWPVCCDLAMRIMQDRLSVQGAIAQLVAIRERCEL